jgi:hypothetical protein
MSVVSLRHDLREFALELRKLAYTMPGGHEDPLIWLSERMARRAQEEAATAGCTERDNEAEVFDSAV